MKYIVFWEFSPEDLDKVIEKQLKVPEVGKKNPGMFAETIFPPHSIGGQRKGFTVVEATPEQIVNGTFYWGPELKMKFMPIVDSATIIELYKKSK
jgi:hypothetical protein